MPWGKRLTAWSYLALFQTLELLYAESHFFPPHLPYTRQINTMQLHCRGYNQGMINFQFDSNRHRKIPTSLENRDGCTERNQLNPRSQVTWGRLHDSL